MWKKLLSFRIWKRIYLERLGEPIIFNLFSIYHLFFGNLLDKIKYDVIPRQPYAFGLNEVFRKAHIQKIKKILIIEFGVASGAGLFNLAYLANKLAKIYNLDYEVIGFDTGKGMPPPKDYRDHPEKYLTGDFPPLLLSKIKLPKKTKIYYGDVQKTINKLKKDLKEKNTRIGFAAIDVDYYSSTLSCLKSFTFNQSFYFSSTVLYFDDVNNPDHNEFCGELLAINEFNKKNINRKICKMTQLKNWRIFKNALWLDQMYFLHVLDSDYRKPKNWKNNKIKIISNPYL
jgi:hypothetical protein